jgi:hypothetical protein
MELVDTSLSQNVVIKRQVANVLCFLNLTVVTKMWNKLSQPNLIIQPLGISISRDNLFTKILAVKLYEVSTILLLR